MMMMNDSSDSSGSSSASSVASSSASTEGTTESVHQYGEQQPLAFSYRRVSSEKQLDGHGIARQLEAARAWCDANNHILSTATFEDLGVSAFKGRNSEVGALKAFLEAVETGAVPQGSTLLVESLDRLSRQHWQRGLGIMTEIVESGVNLVTLFDGKMFKANEPFPFADGIMILVHFERAHNESETKSKRIKAAWKANTEATLKGTRIRTPKTPGWLRIEGDLIGGKYEVIPERAEVVREVFRRFADGEGPSAIARDLNKRGIPTFESGQWWSPTISMLIRSEAVYGHQELGRLLTTEEKSGKVPLPSGTYRKANRVIFKINKGAMPRIIDEDTERRVRFRLTNREGEVKTRNPVRNDTRITKACLTGVAKGDNGEGLKRKRYRVGGAYVSPTTGKYYGAVHLVDRVLIDWWPDLRKAAQVETDTETNGMEEHLMIAQETLEYLQSKPGTPPRIVEAAKAEIEELKAAIKEKVEAHGIGQVDLPRDVSDLTPHEINQLVRRVVSRATIINTGHTEEQMVEVRKKGGGTYERRTHVPIYELRCELKNGLTVNLGPGISGFLNLDQ